MTKTHIVVAVVVVAVVGLYVISRSGSNMLALGKAVQPPPPLPVIAPADYATGKALAFTLNRPTPSFVTPYSKGGL